MFIKSAALAVLAIAAGVGAQGDIQNFTAFTAPVGNTRTFTAGKVETFSWIKTCVAPSESVSATPTKTKVQLMNAGNSSNVFFVQDITEIDCTVTPGVANWTVPEVSDYSTSYSLQIVLAPKISYSGTFKIIPPGGAAVTTAPSSTGTATTPKPTSGAGSVVPAITSAVLAAGAAAFYML